MDPPSCADVHLFVPPQDSLPELGWEAEEGLVELKPDHTTTLVLRNPSSVTMHLCGGEVLGELQPAQELPPTGDPTESASVMVCQVLVQGGEGKGRK